MTWRERWAELKRIYGGHHREVRLTAVGWNPGGEEWIEQPGPTPSGNREYSIIVREGATEPVSETLPKARTVSAKHLEVKA